MRQVFEKMKACGRTLLYTTLCPSFFEGVPICGDCFAEIEFSGTLSKSQKQEYLRFLQLLSANTDFHQMTSRRAFLHAQGGETQACKRRAFSLGGIHENHA